LTDAALIADLVRAGLDPDLVGRVAAAIASSSVGRLSADASADARRARDRKYQKDKRLRTKTEKQTMLGSGKSSADVSADTTLQASNLSSFSSSTESQRSREVKKEEQAKRATRMQPGRQITTEEYEFAQAAGFGHERIEGMWAEYVDYWIAIPGERGLKTNWPATWRNRVRALSTGKRVNGHGSRTATMDGFDFVIGRAASDECGGGSEIRDITPRSGKTG
jgi:hypothetical protein